MKRSLNRITEGLDKMITLHTLCFKQISYSLYPSRYITLHTFIPKCKSSFTSFKPRPPGMTVSLQMPLKHCIQELALIFSKFFNACPHNFVSHKLQKNGYFLIKVSSINMFQMIQILITSTSEFVKSIFFQEWAGNFDNITQVSFVFSQHSEK